jgi:hypothetical protein
MIIGKRPAPKSERKEWGYYAIDESQMGAYVRGGSAAVDWSPPEEGGFDHAFNWKGI